MSALYKTDLARWLQEPAAMLKARQFDALDLDNLVKELERMARQEGPRLWEHLRELLVWFLVWNYASDQRLHHLHWYMRMGNERVALEVLLGCSPSLRGDALEDFQACSQHGWEVASEETGFPAETFPETCPRMVQQVIHHGFGPMGAHELETRPSGLDSDPRCWPDEEDAP
jgi:hypothetical protein